MSKKNKASNTERTEAENGAKKNNIMKKIFVDNIGYKLLAIGIAALMFVIVVGLGLKEML